mgnify:CR=1 FL=1
MCDEDKVGVKLIIKRTVGYYDVHIQNKYMMMDLTAEVFAMLSACFTGVAYLLIGLEIVYPKTKKCEKKLKNCCGCLRPQVSSVDEFTELAKGKKVIIIDNNDEYARNIEMNILRKLNKKPRETLV